MSDLANIAAALIAFQGDMPTVKKSQTAKVPTKTGGSYSYTYAGLADVMREAVPVLVKHGLAFTALPRQTERGYELRGTLMHTSGEMIEGSLPIAGSTPQEMGSSLTYMRRYLFGCITGLVTDDDDDGHLAQKTATRRSAGQDGPALPPRRQSLTDKTRAQMFALFSDLGIPDDEQLPGINRILGTDYESRGRLTEAEAKQVIAVLKRKKETAA
jgi:hypothetical protein